MQKISTVGLIDLTCISQAYMIYEVNYIITSLFHVTCYCSRMGGSRIFKIVGKVIIFQYFLTSVPQHLDLLLYTFNNSSQCDSITIFSALLCAAVYYITASLMFHISIYLLVVFQDSHFQSQHFSYCCHLLFPVMTGYYDIFPMNCSPSLKII